MIWYIADIEDDVYYTVIVYSWLSAHNLLCNECHMLIPKGPGDWNCD